MVGNLRHGKGHGGGLLGKTAAFQAAQGLDSSAQLLQPILTAVNIQRAHVAVIESLG